ncbi:MAG: glycosyltransferase family 39 protein [Acidobacteriota bacterium]|nr:glycosyltransferase family 39 protein [Acidobacteriota bacterium]
MALPTWKRGLLSLAACAALYLLYGFGLDGAGVLGPDEPRYAAIGRAMADSGDWVTPRLWDKPWFEKPALLYWMTALGFKAGLSPDLAPRVPVAVASVAFLIFFFIVLRREFGTQPAFYSTAILSTSAGWLTFSHIGVTDLPLSVCFSSAMLLMIPRESEPETSGLLKPVGAGLFLGLALLAKGLVPLVLVIPGLWFWRKRWRDMAVMMVTTVAIAVPWYGMVILRNGGPFIDEFFWKHHFARFTNGSLQHVRPVWFFVPVLLAEMFPWTPLLLLLFRREFLKPRSVQFLLAWVVFGLGFFSLSENKLPGYILPLLPAIAALMGTRFAKVNRSPWLLGISAASLWCIPLVAEVLPAALLKGASNVQPSLPASLVVGGVLTAMVVAWICWKGDNARGVGLITAGVIAGVTFLMLTAFPALDENVSARGFWRRNGNVSCVESGTRAWLYGLNYYAKREVPDCDPEP